MALSAGVQRPAISDPSYDFGPQKDSTVVFQGALVMMDLSNRIAPAASGTAGAFCCGVAMPRDQDLDRYDNTVTGHADGFITVQYRQGVFGFLNDGTNPIVATTQDGTILYAVDDQTVSLSSSNGARPVAGRLRGLDATVIGGPVLVEVSKQIGKQVTEQLDPPTTIPVVLVKHSNGSVAARFTPGFAGRIRSISASVTDPVTTAAKLATFAPSIAGTPVTGGLLALTSANCTPVGAAVAGSAITALNTFSAAQEITIVASSVTAFVEGQVVIYLMIDSGHF
jgi:hypothetical protein